MLRLSKLTVRDEIENGLAYYRYTFLAEVPKLHESLADVVAHTFGAAVPVPAFLRMGSWIGGDRDGNPFVTAETLDMRSAPRRRSLSITISTRCIGWARSSRCRRAWLSLRRALARLAEAGGDANPHREDEPYRRALTGVYARLAATSVALSGRAPARAPHATLPAYDSAAALITDLAVIEQSLATHHASLLAERRLKPLVRAVQSFGFHLASLDLRQNADVHEAVIAELLARAGVAANYLELAEPIAWRSSQPSSRRRARSRRRTSTMASARARSLRSSRWPRTSIAGTVRRRCRTTSSPSASRCRTFSKSPCS